MNYNLQTLQAHTKADTGSLPISEQRALMLAVVHTMPWAAVDVAIKDKTGTLKLELKRILEQMSEERCRRMSDDELACSPVSPDEAALNQLLAHIR